MSQKEDENPKDKKDFMEQFMRMRKRISDLEEDSKKKGELLAQYDALLKDFNQKLNPNPSPGPAPEPTDEGFLDWLFK